MATSGASDVPGLNQDPLRVQLHPELSIQSRIRSDMVIFCKKKDPELVPEVGFAEVIRNLVSINFYWDVFFL